MLDLVRLYRPLAVLFDLRIGHPDFAVALLVEQPGLLLIGLDLSSNEMIVLSRHSQQVVSVLDLVEVIGQK